MVRKAFGLRKNEAMSHDDMIASHILVVRSRPSAPQTQLIERAIHPTPNQRASFSGLSDTQGRAQRGGREPARMQGAALVLPPSR